MDSRVTALLLTGKPGVGKTTILRKVVANLEAAKLRGFLTDEIREDGERVGFRLAPFKGEGAVLAHVDSKSPHRVGRYHVNVHDLERIVDSTLTLKAMESGAIVVIDEIGKMECFSERFVEAVKALVDSRRVLIGTVARKGGGFIAEVKERSDIELWEVSRKNRDRLASDVLAWLDARRSSWADASPKSGE